MTPLSGQVDYKAVGRGLEKEFGGTGREGGLPERLPQLFGIERSVSPLAPAVGEAERRQEHGVAVPDDTDGDEVMTGIRPSLRERSWRGDDQTTESKEYLPGSTEGHRDLPFGMLSKGSIGETAIRRPGPQ
jgi:hypothetical protein